jgi:ABC-type transport system involved in Fe-S cluster assembly fused permease/ATPase subunit
MANGEVIKLNYFLDYVEEFEPIIDKHSIDVNGVEVVTYSSQFLSPWQMAQNFVILAEREMKKSEQRCGQRLIKVSDNGFIRWDAICKIEIEMQKIVIAFDKVEIGFSKRHPIIKDKPRIVTDLSELEIKEEV